jgi:hypothetical protein
MTDCAKIPTLQNIYDSKSSMDDVNSFTYDTNYTFVDSKGVTRPTLTGLMNSFGGITRNKFIATSNQLTYTMPSTTTVVSFVYVQGIYQFSPEDYEFDNVTKLVTFANPGLTLGNKVEIFSGIVPNIEGDASNLMVTSTDSSSSKPLKNWTQDIVDLKQTQFPVNYNDGIMRMVILYGQSLSQGSGGDTLENPIPFNKGSALMFKVVYDQMIQLFKQVPIQ